MKAAFERGSNLFKYIYSKFALVHHCISETAFETILTQLARRKLSVRWTHRDLRYRKGEDNQSLFID